MEENDQQPSLDDVPLEQLQATKQQFVQERVQKAAQMELPQKDSLDGLSLEDLQQAKLAHQMRNEQILAPHRQQVQQQADAGTLPYGAQSGVGPFLARAATSPLRGPITDLIYANAKGNLARGEADDTDLRRIALYEREKGLNQEQPEWAQWAALPLNVAGNVAPTALTGGANIAAQAYAGAAAHQGGGALNPAAVTEAAPSFLLQMGVLKAMGPVAQKLFPGAFAGNAAQQIGAEALTGTAGMAVADYGAYVTGLQEHGGPIKDALDGKLGDALKGTVGNLLFTGAMAAAHGGGRERVEQFVQDVEAGRKAGLSPEASVKKAAAKNEKLPAAGNLETPSSEATPEPEPPVHAAEEIPGEFGEAGQAALKQAPPTAPGSPEPRPPEQAAETPKEAPTAPPGQSGEPKPAESAPTEQATPPEQVETMRAALKSLGLNSGKWSAEKVMAEARKLGIDKATERAPEPARPPVEEPIQPQAAPEPQRVERRQPGRVSIGGSEVLKRGQAMDPAEAHALEKYGEGNVVRVELHSGGNKVGHATLAEEGDSIHVAWVGAEGMKGGEGRGNHPFGSREIFSLAHDLARSMPDAKWLKYTASEGRIRQGEPRMIDLDKLRLRGQDQKAVTEAGPERVKAAIAEPHTEETKNAIESAIRAAVAAGADEASARRVAGESVSGAHEAVASVAPEEAGAAEPVRGSEPTTPAGAGVPPVPEPAAAGGQVRPLDLKSGLEGALKSVADPLAKDWIESALFNGQGDPKRLAGEAVAAWESLKDPAGRAAIEKALLASGAEKIGEAGQPTEFVGRLHDTRDKGAFSGKKVEVVEPGWLLRDEGGETLLAKAKVRLAGARPIAKQQAADQRRIDTGVRVALGLGQDPAAAEAGVRANIAAEREADRAKMRELDAAKKAGEEKAQPTPQEKGERLNRSRVEAKFPDVFEQADAAGVDRGDVHQAAREKLNYERKQVEEVNRVHDELLSDWPELRKAQRGIKSDKVEELESVKGYDEPAEWLEKYHPGMLRRGETGEDAVYRIIQEGRLAVSEEDAYRHALDYHLELKRAAAEESSDVRKQVQRVGERFTEEDRRALEKELRGEEGGDEEGVLGEAGHGAGDPGGFAFGANEPAEPAGLTPQHKQALDLKAQGLSLRASAAKMGVSHEQVRTYLREAAEAQGKAGSYEESVVKPRAAERLDELSEEPRHGHFDANTGRWLEEKVKLGERLDLGELSLDPGETPAKTPEKKLTQKQQAVLRLREQGKTSEDIARQLGLTPEAVERLEAKAGRRLESMSADERSAAASEAYVKAADAAGKRGLPKEQQQAAGELAFARVMGIEAPTAKKIMAMAVDFLKEEGGFIDPSQFYRGALQRAAQLAEGFKRASRYLGDNYRELSGQMFPRITRLGREAGEAVARFVSAPAYARLRAPQLIDKVLGPNAAESDRTLYGAVMTEEQLRYTRKAYEKKAREESDEALRLKAAGDLDGAKEHFDLADAAGKAARRVATAIGQQWSPLKDFQHYKDLVTSPRYQEIVKAWEAHMVPEMEDNYRRSQGLDPADPIDSFTQIPGRPMNLLAAEEPGGTGPGGKPNFQALKMGKNPFSNVRTGAAEKYNLDLGAIVENSINRGATNAAKAEAIRTMVEQGVASWGKPGERVEGAKEFPFTKPPKGTQENAQQETSLYVHTDAAKEWQKAITLGDRYNIPAVTAALNAVTKANLMVQTAETVYHSRNLLTFLTKPGVMPQDLIKNAYGVIAKTPAVLDRIVELARIGAMKEHGFEAPGLFANSKLNPNFWMGKLLGILDQTMRLTADDAFTRLAARGERFGAKDTETNRRNFINQLGQYNKRAQNDLTVALRESGFGPFATGGGGYYMQGLRALTMNPGVEARTTAGAVAFRAEMLARTIGALSMVGLANYLAWGRVDGDDKTPIGAIKFSPENGKHRHLDVLPMVSGLTRGAREVGALAMFQGQREGRPEVQTKDRAVEAVWHSLLHPAVGPGVQFAYTAATGKNTQGFQVAEKPPEGVSHAWMNLQAALKNASPLYATLTDADRPKEKATAKEKVMKLLGAYGVQSRK